MTRLGGGVADGWWGMEKKRPKVLGRTQRRSFLGFPSVLNYRAGRLRLPGGTILIRKLGESLRAIRRMIVEKRNRDHSKARGPGGNIGDVRNREEIARQIFAWTWIAKMSTFSWRKDEFATGYQNDEEEMEDHDSWPADNSIG